MVAYLKTQSVLELLNNFSNLSTVAYKGVAYKKKSCNQIADMYDYIAGSNLSDLRIWGLSQPIKPLLL